MLLLMTSHFVTVPCQESETVPTVVSPLLLALDFANCLQTRTCLRLRINEKVQLTCQVEKGFLEMEKEHTKKACARAFLK